VLTRKLLALIFVLILVPVVTASVGFTLPEKPHFSYSWATMAGRYTIDVDKEGIAFTQISLNYRDTAEDTTLIVRPLESDPINETIDGEVYKFLEIDTIRIREATAADIVIRFKVEKGWLDDRGSVEDVVLMRHSNSWEGLNTTFLEDDDENYYFESPSPGFSYFAIVLEKPIVEEVTEPEVEEELEGEEEVEEKGVSFRLAGLGLIILIVLSGALFYFIYKKKK
jgi:PGF-pre-PGF domain-containing protein